MRMVVMEICKKRYQVSKKKIYKRARNRTRQQRAKLLRVAHGVTWSTKVPKKSIGFQQSVGLPSQVGPSATLQQVNDCKNECRLGWFASHRIIWFVSHLFVLFTWASLSNQSLLLTLIVSTMALAQMSSTNRNWKMERIAAPTRQL